MTNTNSTYVNSDGVTVIPKGIKITGFKVKNNKIEIQSEKTKTDNLEFVHEDINRPFKLRGNTYRLKPPHEKNSLYLTVNDILMNEGTNNEQEYPYEIFLNSKDMENYQWITTVTRTVSAIFRKGGNITFIVEELERITQPDGGYWGKDHAIGKGKFYGSVVAEIGYILRLHMIELGLMEDPLAKLKATTDKYKAHEPSPSPENERFEQFGSEKVNTEEDIPPGHVKMDMKCPDCGSEYFRMVDGCPRCHNGHSKCG